MPITNETSVDAIACPASSAAVPRSISDIAATIAMVRTSSGPKRSRCLELSSKKRPRMRPIAPRSPPPSSFTSP
jgi:hypothetical protein